MHTIITIWKLVNEVEEEEKLKEEDVVRKERLDDLQIRSPLSMIVIERPPNIDPIISFLGLSKKGGLGGRVSITALLRDNHIVFNRYRWMSTVCIDIDKVGEQSYNMWLTGVIHYEPSNAIQGGVNFDIMLQRHDVPLK